MKQFIIIGTVAVFLLSSFSGKSNSQISRYLSVKAFVEEYTVIGKTRHEFSKNYTINLRVVGVTTELRKSIDYVEYKNGENWERIPYYNTSYDEHTYYVTIDNENYYFTFDTPKQEFK